jgi:LAS superfamily LD-carboxypeptidase LdcB
VQNPRSAVLIAAVMAVVMIWTPGPSSRSSAGEKPSARSVERLRKQADQAKNELAKATSSWEKRKAQLDASQEKLKQTLVALGQADAQMAQIRVPLARLAASAYKQPGVIGIPALLGSDDPDQALAAATDMSMLSGDQKALIDKAGQLRTRREQLAATAQDLQSRDAVEQTQLQQEVDGLKARAAKLTQQLTSELNKLDPETRLRLTCRSSMVSEAKQYPNGLIPARFLCPLPQKGRSLRADAAQAFFRLNTAYKAHFGHPMCLTDSYRPLSEQQSIYSQRPGMAAVPGHSNHGWGTAIDLCGGVQNQGSAEFNWLQSNSRHYEWFHPSWAYSSPFEPWHWEYTKEDTPASSD